MKTRERDKAGTLPRHDDGFVIEIARLVLGGIQELGGFTRESWLE